MADIQNSLDYYDVPPERVGWAKETVAAIIQKLIVAKEALRESGKYFQQLKKTVPPGRWLEFLENEFGLQPRRVQLYMASSVAAENYDPAIIRKLPLQTAAALGSKRTSRLVGLQIVEDARSGSGSRSRVLDFCRKNPIQAMKMLAPKQSPSIKWSTLLGTV